MSALVTGGTGLLGRELISRLQEAVVLTRDPGGASRKLGPVRAFGWEPESGPAPAEALRGVNVVFNLAGESLAEGRWTADKKRRIRNSRIVGTRNLVAGLGALDRRPDVLVSASAVGYYGDRGDEALDESAEGGRGFLAEVCDAWEHEALAAEKLGVRVVCVRIGVVLAQGGGALARMSPAFKMGAGGRLGTGKQWMPWIHIDDAVGLLLHAAGNTTIRGALNAVAPAPVTNADFTRAFGHAVNRPAFLAVPKTALRVAFGEMSEVLLASQRVFPRVAERTSYRFQHAQLAAALADVLNPVPRRVAA